MTGIRLSLDSKVSLSESHLFAFPVTTPVTGIIMGKSHKDPPAYSRSKGYIRWKTEVNLWADMIGLNDTLKKETIGQVVALNALPDSEAEGDIRGKVIEALGDKLKGADGLKTLLGWMDTHMGRDSTQNCVDKAAAFMKFFRKDGQDIKDYLASFDAKYNSAKSAGLGDMGQIFLMFMVIDHAQLTEQQFQLVLAGIDLTKKDTLYDQAKTAIIKYMAGINIGSGAGNGEGIKLKQETGAFFLKNSWKPQTPYRPKFPIRGAGAAAPRFGAAPTSGQRFGGAGAFSGAARSFGPRTPVQMPRNPIRNGKQDLCDICGSWSHYRVICPFNPNTQTMVGAIEEDGTEGYLHHGDHVFYSEDPQIIEEADTKEDQSEDINQIHFSQLEDKNAVNHVTALLASLQGTSNKKKEEVNVCYAHVYNADLANTGFGEVVLDTGCIKSVSSTARLNSFFSKLHPATRDRIRVEHSNRIFKFGGGQKRTSVGTFYIPCSLQGANMIFIVDGVEQDDLPCLMSKEGMKRAGVLIDVKRDVATIFGKEVKLKENEAGHYIIELEDYNYNSGEHAVMWTGEEKDEDQVIRELTKIHKGLGHPSHKALERMIKADGSFSKTVDNALNKIYENCSTCLQFRKGKSTPKVAPPMAYEVNDCMTLDLKLYPKWGRNILYMVDDFSRYMTAVPITDKEGKTIVREFMAKWIFGTPYGPCKSVLTDNGTEFVNKEFREMCERLGIRHVTTGAYSPWGNGKNERNHHTVDIMLEKMLHDDPSMKFEDALAKAVYARNTMINVNGFSPAQILAGKQPRLPGATNDNDPSQDEIETTSQTVFDHIKGLQVAKKAFIKTDCGNKLKTAMEVRESPLVHYPVGTMVHYKFGNDQRWHGPGRIVGQENKVVLIRHGGHIISTSQTRVYKSPGQEQMAGGSQAGAEAGQTASQTRLPQTRLPPRPNSSSDSDSDSEPEDNSSHGRPARRDRARTPPPPLRSAADTAVGGDRRGEGADGRVETGSEQDSNETSPERIQSRPETEPRLSPTEPFQFRPDQLQDISPEENQLQDISPEESDINQTRDLNEMSDNAVTKSPTIKGKTLPKKGNWILYKRPEDEIWFRAQVINKGVKASNPTPYFNIQPQDDRQKGVNLNEFDWTFDSPESAKNKTIYSGVARKNTNSGERRKKDPNTNKEKEKEVNSGSPKLKERRDKEYATLYSNYVHFVNDKQIERAERAEIDNPTYMVFIPKEDWAKPFVIEAMEKEIKNFQNYNAYKEVVDLGQPRMSSGWVVTEKCYGDVIGCKARLVVHGNQEGFSDSVDSPTVSKQTLRLQFTLAAQMGWEIVMADITSAFLQSNVLDREVYVQPPKGTAKPGFLWRLLKPMYGLGDASLQWYKTLAQKLVELGCKRLTTDPAMFYWQGPGGELEGLVSWHVDDMIGAGNDKFYKTVLNPLMNTFTFGSTSEGKYRCLGWNVVHRKNDILVSQDDYIEAKVEFLDIQVGRHKGTDFLGQEDIAKVRALIGKLRWLADQCRPDIAYLLLELSIQAHAPTYDTVKMANKVVAQVKNRAYSLRFSKLQNKDWHITVFADASLKGLPDKTSSAMGYIIMLTDGFRPGNRAKVNVLSWKSCKTKRIVASTYDAETLALTTALEEAIFIRDQISKMVGLKEKDIRIEAFSDCNDTVEAVLANKPLPNRNSRLAALEIARIKEMRELEMLHSINWVPTTLMLADALTKKGVNIEQLVETISQGRFYM